VTCCYMAFKRIDLAGQHVRGVGVRCARVRLVRSLRRTLRCTRRSVDFFVGVALPTLHMQRHARSPRAVEVPPSVEKTQGYWQTGRLSNYGLGLNVFTRGYTCTLFCFKVELNLRPKPKT
jgi:hypothetical protein